MRAASGVWLSCVLAWAACGDEPSSGPMRGDAGLMARQDAGAAHDAGGAQREGGTGPAPAQDASASEPVEDGGGRAVSDASTRYGEPYAGGEFHLGPVDWEETRFHNACASERKYLPAVREAAGTLLAGTWVGLQNPEEMCDACIAVTTERGKSAVLRVVTYGETSRNSLDVSPDAYALLDSGEYPRHVRWQLTKCPETGPLMYEFKTGSNPWWTAFWVRNARVPIARVEVQTPDGPPITVTREGDGSFVDGSGVGDAAFSIRVTAVDGQVLTDSFRWSEPELVGQVTLGQRNFD